MTARRKIKTPRRYIMFNGITIVPVEGRPDMWHVPGRARMSTRELVARAEERDLPITLTTYSRTGLKVVSLR